MPLPLAAMAVGAATPFIANALSKLFAGDAEAEERAALERAKAEPQRIATGGTTQGQAGLSYARARALQELAGQAQRGTAQQRAGLQREAMRTGADVQARYASQLAELRSMEQERARQRVAEIEGAKSALAGREAQRQRQMVAGAITGVATPLVTSLLTPAAATEGVSSAEREAYNAEQASKRLAPYGLDNPNNPFRSTDASVLETPVTNISAGPAPTSQELASIGLTGAPAVAASTYQSRTGMPGVTASEASLAPSAQLEALKSERAGFVGNAQQNLAGQSTDYTAGMGKGGEFTNLADRMKMQTAPEMLPVQRQGILAGQLIQKPYRRTASIGRGGLPL